MTQTEYLSLKATLVQGCNSERFDLINGMLTRQRAEFAMGLTLAPSDHNVERTWQMLATSLAGDVLDLLQKIGQLEACSDRFNAACECEACEMERAASPAELAALEALHSATVHTDSLQGAL